MRWWFYNFLFPWRLLNVENYPIKYSFISGSIGSSLRTGSKPTPIRLRSDIQSERRIRQVNLTGVQEGGASSSQGG